MVSEHADGVEEFLTKFSFQARSKKELRWKHLQCHCHWRINVSEILEVSSEEPQKTKCKIIQKELSETINFKVRWKLAF